MLFHWLLYLALLAAMLAGLFITLLNFPGLWVMFVAAGIYLWATHGMFLGYRSLIAIGVIALLAEIVEFFAATAGAKRAGASRGGLLGAVVRALVGAIFFTGLIPIPIVAQIVGVCVGTFLGAAVGELLAGKEVGGSLRVGAGAAKGRFLGTMAKLMFGVMILFIVLWTAMPIGKGVADGSACGDHGIANDPSRVMTDLVFQTICPSLGTPRETPGSSRL